jgi:hypothetical protein
MPGVNICRFSSLKLIKRDPGKCKLGVMEIQGTVLEERII